VAKSARTIFQRGEQEMKKSDWQYLVDTFLFISIAGIAVIGFLMGLVIPKGPAAPESTKYFLGLHRHQWSNIHFYLSIAFIVFATIHILLGWKWIKNKARQIFKNRWNTALIFTAIAPVLLVILLWALCPRTPGSYEGYGARAGERAQPQPSAQRESAPHEKKSEVQKKEEIHEAEHEQKLTRGISAEDQSGILITGRMTLRDLGKETRIPARRIADKLNLPSTISLDESLGRLRRRFGFTIQDVRDAIASLMEKKQKKS
jgi:hypothetical protein